MMSVRDMSLVSFFMNRVIIQFVMLTRSGYTP